MSDRSAEGVVPAAVAGGFSSVRGGALSVLLAWVSSLLVVLLILEVGFRILPIPLADPVVTINEPDATLGWVKRRNESTRKKTSEFDVTFRINSLGLRDDDGLTLKKPEGVRRVLVVGDSFVLGYTVDRSALFVDRIERALLADGRNVQVLNGGTEGYSTDQELLWLRTEGLKLEPDVVVLCFYQNDVYMNGQNQYVGKVKPRFSPSGDGSAPEPMPAMAADPVGFFARHSAIGGFLHNFGTQMKHSEALVHRSGETEMPIEDAVALTAPAPSLRIEDCWARTATALRGFKSTCDAQHLPLLFVTIPSREEVEKDSLERYLAAKRLSPSQFDPHLPTGRAADIARGLAIDVLDPLPALQASAAPDRPLYYVKDWHLNPAGNRVLAQVIYERLCTCDYLGEAPTAAGRAAFESKAGSTAGIPGWVWFVAVAWSLLSFLYARSYRDESAVLAPLKIGALIGSVVLVIFVFGRLVPLLGPTWGRYVGAGLVLLIVGYILVKSWSKLGIIREVYGSFVRGGHWYMLPLLVAMLTIGSLLVVASSSPFVAPFIYTLF